MLQVGEVARIDFTNATSVPLHIATQDGTYYEMHVVPSDPGGESGGAPYKTLVAPNNTNYTDKFVYAEVGRTEADTSTFYSTTADAFIIGQYFSDSVCYIINHTVYKCVKCMITAYGNPNNYPAVFLTSTNWRDTTTTWTSLGTVTFSQASSGRILVKRIM